MMIWKLAVREMRTGRGRYGFIRIQFFLLFLAIMTLVSVIQAESRQYLAFRNMLGQSGWFLRQSGITRPENPDMTIRDTEELEIYLKSARAAACYVPSGYFSKDGNVLTEKAIIYDTELLSVFQPELSEGRWLDEEDIKTNIIEAVVLPNSFGLKTGDMLFLHSYEQGDNEPLPVQIVGMISEESEIIDYQITDNMVNYRNFFSEIKNRDRQEAFLILGYEDVLAAGESPEQGKELVWMLGSMFVICEEDALPTDIMFNENFLKSYGDISKMESFDIVRQKSAEVLQGQIRKYMPLVWCAGLLAVISMVCVELNLSEKQRKNLAVFHMLGLPWRECRQIRFWCYLILMGEAFVAAVFAVWGISFAWPQQILHMGVWQALFSLGVSVLFLCGTAAGMFFTGKYTAYQKWVRKQG